MQDLVPEAGLAAWRHFLRAHAATISLIETELERSRQLPLVWYDVLIAVSASPKRRLRIGSLGRELVLTRSGATRLVDGLEAAQLVRREPAADDQRGVDVLLTRQGRRALAKAWPMYARGINELFVSVLTESEQTKIAEGLGRVAQLARAKQAAQASSDASTGEAAN